MSGSACECEEGLPEWIMSYADMITILMAFFVVMYSMAGAPNKAKEAAVLKSLHQRFGPMWPGITSLSPGPFIRENSPLARLTNGRNGKNSKGARGQGDGTPRGDRPHVLSLRQGDQTALGGTVFFPEGSDALSTDLEKQLQVIANDLDGKPQKIEIRGHSSRKPSAAEPQGRNSWDLTYARCRHTMDYLVSAGIDARRIRLSMAGDNEPPLKPAGTALGQSSRVEVFLLNEVIDLLKDEPSLEPAMEGKG